MKMFSNKNYRPDKDSWFRYYMISPVQNLFEALREGSQAMYRKIIGGWYCEHCKCFHGRRVIKCTIQMPGLFVNQTEWDVCSVGVDRFKTGEWKPEQRNALLDALDSLGNAMKSCGAAGLSDPESEEDYEQPEQHAGEQPK